MSVELRGRVAAILEREGIVLRDDALTRLVVSYPRCLGPDPWGVRVYARAAAPQGMREYRVTRGAGIQDVFTSPERHDAEVVGSALNELESHDPIR
jgi:hypothetical protein